MGGHRDAQLLHLEFGPQVSEYRRYYTLLQKITNYCQKRICYSGMRMLLQVLYVPTTYSENKIIAECLPLNKAKFISQNKWKERVKIGAAFAPLAVIAGITQTLY